MPPSATRSSPREHVGPRPTGGVGGTRTGVKCLHAHWAWHLAGGDDPVGRWIERQLLGPDGSGDGGDDRPDLIVGETATIVHVPVEDVPSGLAVEVPWGAHNLTDRWLREHDPPRPEDLTNALGTITDELDDIIRRHPELVDLTTLRCTGPGIAPIAQVEIGLGDVPDEVELSKPDAEEIFRMLAAEPSHDRAHNPGLASHDVETVLASCCILLSFVRRLHLAHVTLVRTGS